jgi:hypothetical protein
LNRLPRTIACMAGGEECSRLKSSCLPALPSLKKLCPSLIVTYYSANPIQVESWRVESCPD